MRENHRCTSSLPPVMACTLVTKFSAVMAGRPSRLVRRFSTVKICCLVDLALCDSLPPNCPTTLRPCCDGPCSNLLGFHSFVPWSFWKVFLEMVVTSAPVLNLKSMLHPFKYMDSFHDVSWVAVTVSRKLGWVPLLKFQKLVLLKH